MKVEQLISAAREMHKKNQLKREKQGNTSRLHKLYVWSHRKVFLRGAQ
jgi:hypothetical protein